MRLIDADALKEWLTAVLPKSSTADTALNALDDMPTVDAMPVIRCKDCKYWDVSKSNILNHTCYWGHFLKKEDDYCSWAKPKEKYEKEENKGSD